LGVVVNQAKLVYADGSAAVVTTDINYKTFTTGVAPYLAATNITGEVVTYSVNTLGQTVLDMKVVMFMIVKYNMPVMNLFISLA